MNGETVSQAPIEAKNTDTGVVSKTTSSLDGSYSFLQLAPGKYEISSPVAGFERKLVTVHASEVSPADIHFTEIGISLGTVGDRPLEKRIASYNRPAPPPGPTPRTPDGKPDFSGFWTLVNTNSGKPEMQPWAEALAKYRVDTDIKDSPGARCLPDGVSPLSQLIQTSTYLVVLMQFQSQSHRLIFLDGRDHPKDLDPTWFGHSIGKWEGDTLVIDRVGFNEGSWLDAVQGLPHTDLLHVIERNRRIDLGHLEVETTIEDPGAYLKPWMTKRTYELQPNQEVSEYVCNENNVYTSLTGR